MYWGEFGHITVEAGLLYQDPYWDPYGDHGPARALGFLLKIENKSLKVVTLSTVFIESGQRMNANRADFGSTLRMGSQGANHNLMLDNAGWLLDSQEFRGL
jgi:hypothetical protein